MTLEIGARSTTTRSSGFSLLEVLLAIAIIAIAAGAVMVNLTGFLDLGEDVPPEQTLITAIRTARFKSASQRQLATIQFDKENGSLLLSTGDSFLLGKDFGKEGPAEIRFYLVPPAKGLGPFPDAKQTSLSTNLISFAPDRSSSPFVAEIDTGNGKAERFIFDPFSSLVRSSE